MQSHSVCHWQGKAQSLPKWRGHCWWPSCSSGALACCVQKTQCSKVLRSSNRTDISLRRCAAAAAVTAAVIATAAAPGRCATLGICGHRADGDPLSCVEPTPAATIDPELARKLQAVCPQLAATAPSALCCTAEQLDQLQARVQVASIFLVGCPACAHNFKHFFCLLTCSPDQATFTHVTATQTARDTNATVVAQMDVWVAGGWVGGWVDSKLMWWMAGTAPAWRAYSFAEHRDPQLDTANTRLPACHPSPLHPAQPRLARRSTRAALTSCTRPSTSRP